MESFTLVGVLMENLPIYVGMHSYCGATLYLQSVDHVVICQLH